MMTGVNLVHVPYRGGAPATTDLIGGHLQVIFSPVSESIAYIKAGRLRPLAVTTATRPDVLPDIPTVAEFVPGYEASGFAGIGAPRNTPVEIIDMLNKELNAGSPTPKSNPASLSWAASSSVAPLRNLARSSRKPRKSGEG
jgi:tripartite-type tricarboxylate transporter receptor subunit TctC